MMKQLMMLISLTCLVASCVSMKKYNLLKADAIRFDSERTVAREKNNALTAQNSELNNSLQALSAECEGLRSQINALNIKYQELLATGSSESSRMLEELEKKEKRLAELEAKLRNREEAIQEIRRKVTDALLGFNGKGLTITQKDGKVYVSMEDKLLFRSGSFEVGSEGAKAVRELAEVLASNPDINIVVEGHTDNVPYKENGLLKDNLDLSVKRATTVTRMILENSAIAPERITASGRGEYLPLAPGNTSTARQKNRRTEIILTPKFDELLELMNSK